jgi:putative acetyltransferase
MLPLANVAAVWLTASSDLLQSRIYASSAYETKSAREKALIDKFLARSWAYDEQIMDRAHRLGLATVRLKETSTIDELVRTCLALLEEQTPGIAIRQIRATHKGVAELLIKSTEHASSLYPAESNHLDSADELAQPNVYLAGAFFRDRLVGMGAVKRLADDGSYGEIKRLFVLPAYRGNGLAKRIMNALEGYLSASGISIARLETGIYQPEALGLYTKLGYRVRDPFGTYQPDRLSVFMEKRLGG